MSERSSQHLPLAGAAWPIEASRRSSFLGINLNGNKGFEGLTYDAAGDRLVHRQGATRASSTRSVASLPALRGRCS